MNELVPLDPKSPPGQQTLTGLAQRLTPGTRLKILVRGRTNEYHVDLKLVLADSLVVTFPSNPEPWIILIRAIDMLSISHAQ